MTGTYWPIYCLDHGYVCHFHASNVPFHVAGVPLKSPLKLEGFTQAMKVIFRTMRTHVINYLEHLRPSVGTAGGPIRVLLTVL